MLLLLLLLLMTMKMLTVATVASHPISCEAYLKAKAFVQNGWVGVTGKG